MTKENIHINNRTIYFADNVTSETIGKTCAEMLKIIKEDDENEASQKNYKRKPINLFIQSEGGSVYAMWSLIDIIEKSKTPIHTYCTGYAMSAGLKIFLAGHKRYCTRHATFMYHQMRSIRMGTYQDLVEDREQLDHLNKQSEDYVLERTKITKERVEEIRYKKINWYIHPKEALELGIVDEII